MRLHIVITLPISALVYWALRQRSTNQKSALTNGKPTGSTPYVNGSFKISFYTSNIVPKLSEKNNEL